MPDHCGRPPLRSGRDAQRRSYCPPLRSGRDAQRRSYCHPLRSGRPAHRRSTVLRFAPAALRTVVSTALVPARCRAGPRAPRAGPGHPSSVLRAGFQGGGSDRFVGACTPVTVVFRPYFRRSSLEWSWRRIPSGAAGRSISEPLHRMPGPPVRTTLALQGQEGDRSGIVPPQVAAAGAARREARAASPPPAPSPLPQAPTRPPRRASGRPPPSSVPTPGERVALGRRRQISSARGPTGHGHHIPRAAGLRRASVIALGRVGEIDRRKLLAVLKARVSRSIQEDRRSRNVPELTRPPIPGKAATRAPAHGARSFTREVTRR
jgi:hypothetical protein